MSKSVIKVEGISKQYRLGTVGTGTLTDDVNRWWYKLRGKEDPFLKVGEENDRATKGSSNYVWSLQDINFEVKQGEVVGFIGRNGAGKSTLLKILSRTTKPTRGKVKLKGRVASLLEVGTGFHPEISGRDNIFLNGAILGMTNNEIKRKFDEIVDFSGVERFIDTPVKRYSSGMYVRLAFAVAAHLEPEILIIDEVLAVGDAEFQRKCLGKMKDVSHNEGRTVLFVSHQMGAITKLCDTAIVLSQGKNVYKGTSTDAVNYYIEKYSSNILQKYTNVKENEFMYLTEVTTVNDYGEETSEYACTKPVRLNIKGQINKNVEGAKIGIALLDKYGNRVFSDYFDLNAALSVEGASRSFNVTAALPINFFTPNNYSFLVALLIDGRLFDIVEECCSFRITDNGSELGLHEGYDYGHVFVKCNWNENN